MKGATRNLYMPPSDNSLEVSGISEYFTQSFLTSSTGTEMDVPRGMQYMEKAAKQGLPQAQYMVSRQQLEGHLLVQHVNLRKSGLSKKLICA